jgi:hypothetical protein
MNSELLGAPFTALPKTLAAASPLPLSQARPMA